MRKSVLPFASATIALAFVGAGCVTTIDTGTDPSMPSGRHTATPTAPAVSDHGGADGGSTPAPTAPDPVAGDGGAAAPDLFMPPPPPPPVASGCITDVTSGAHTYSCEGYPVDVTIPAACQKPGCGVILELHGDSGTGPWFDAHTNLRALGSAAGYIVVAPTGKPIGLLPSGVSYPGSTWTQADDAPILRATQAIADVFRVDRNKIHLTGFSRGGMMAWRMLCDHADFFASAAPGGAGSGFKVLADQTMIDPTCFENGRAPSRKVPILQIAGRMDLAVSYASQVAIRNAAITAYGANPAAPVTVGGDANYTRLRWTSADGAIVEVLDHNYVLPASNIYAGAKGHCIPGTSAPTAVNYGFGCQLPNAFAFGAEVLAFFMAHPKR